MSGYTFGSAPARARAAASAAPSLFGSSAPAAPTSSLFSFGSTAPAPAAAPTSSLFSFGSSAPTAPTSSLFSFGSTAPAPAAAPTSSLFSFGSTASTAPARAAPSLFGSTASSAPTAPTSSLFSFGSTASTAPAAPTSSLFSFGSTAPAPAPAAAPTSSLFSFGSTAPAYTAPAYAAPTPAFTRSQAAAAPLRTASRNPQLSLNILDESAQMWCGTEAPNSLPRFFHEMRNTDNLLRLFNKIQSPAMSLKHFYLNATENYHEFDYTNTLDKLTVAHYQDYSQYGSVYRPVAVYCRYQHAVETWGHVVAHVKIDNVWYNLDDELGIVVSKVNGPPRPDTKPIDADGNFIDNLYMKSITIVSVNTSIAMRDSFGNQIGRLTGIHPYQGFPQGLYTFSQGGATCSSDAYLSIIMYSDCIRDTFIELFNLYKQNPTAAYISSLLTHVEQTLGTTFYYKENYSNLLSLTFDRYATFIGKYSVRVPVDRSTGFGGMYGGKYRRHNKYTSKRKYKNKKNYKVKKTRSGFRVGTRKWSKTANSVPPKGNPGAVACIGSDAWTRYVKRKHTTK